ncbi:MAG: hypothetical protein KIT08_03180 [Anaerolineales bacterium]|nr:MAG: hypothetical protein KIT08_03180 [Anaerolineales bacterium]
MSAEHTSEHGSGLSATDIFVGLLGAGTIAGVVWSVVFGLFAGAAFGLEYFQVQLPQIAADGLHIASQVLPWLAAIPAAWFGYQFIIRLP